MEAFIKYYQSIFILLLLSLSQLAQAYSCRDIRLDAGGRSMDLVPVRSQHLGTCYSYAASQAVDAWRISHGTVSSKKPEYVDPIHMAFLYSAYYLDEPIIKPGDKGSESSINGVRTKQLAAKDIKLGIEGGNSLGFKKVFLRRKRVCVMDKPGQTLFDKMKGNSTQKREFIASLYNLATKYLFYKIGTKSHTVDEDNEFEQKTYEEFIKIANKVSLEQEIQDRIVENIKPVLASCIKLGQNCQSYSLINALLFTGCKSTILDYDMREMLATSFNPNGVNSSILVINALLGSPNAQPIAIAMCSKIFYSKSKKANYIGVKRGFWSMSIKEDCGNHAVLIIGSRNHEGRCQYLVRNSWGGCMKRSDKPYDCAGENYWIDAEYLIQNSYDIEYMTNPFWASFLKLF